MQFADNLGITYQSIQEIMKPYAKEYMLMGSIVQDARDLAKLQLFGSAEENMQYGRGVLDHVRGGKLSSLSALLCSMRS